MLRRIINSIAMGSLFFTMSIAAQIKVYNTSSKDILVTYPGVEFYLPKKSGVSPWLIENSQDYSISFILCDTPGYMTYTIPADESIRYINIADLYLNQTDNPTIIIGRINAQGVADVIIYPKAFRPGIFEKMHK